MGIDLLTFPTSIRNSTNNFGQELWRRWNRHVRFFFPVSGQSTCDHASCDKVLYWAWETAGDFVRDSEAWGFFTILATLAFGMICLLAYWLQINQTFLYSPKSLYWNLATPLHILDLIMQTTFMSCIVYHHILGTTLTRQVLVGLHLNAAV